jgi:hypothetical protein
MWFCVSEQRIIMGLQRNWIALAAELRALDGANSRLARFRC